MTGSTVEDLYKDSEVNIQKIVSKYEIPPPDDSVKTEDIKLKDAWVRVFTPPSATGNEPVGLFMHGGGWIMGSVDHEDAACRHIAKSTGMKVVSIGYRLAPKYKFPHGLNDCVEATLWTLEHFSLSSVLLMGGSAGANLAFGVALRLVDAGVGDKVRGIVALVPCTVHPDAVPEDKKEHFTAHQENAFRTVNTSAAMKCFLDSYAPPPADKYFSVLLHPRLKDLKRCISSNVGRIH
jgi:versiconal hemiacetal acetate esterase